MRPRRIGREIEGLSVAIDGYDWEDCIFKDCEIVLSKGDLSMVNCHFHDCRLVLRDYALVVGKIIELHMQGKPINFIKKE
jgi:hypothetical protein